MNNITDLLDLEDSDIKISDIIIEGQTKTLIIETPPVASYCPICGFRMHSRGVKKRTINHPILQDGYSLILLLKQRRWRCSNPDCLYEVNESFRFVNKGRRTTNATDMLIVEAYRNLLETSASIAKRFHMSDTYVHEIFDRYVKLDRLPLTDAISIDEVHLDMDDDCKYALVIQDFHTSNPIDLLRSRRTSVTEPYFVSIPATERNQVKYLISPAPLMSGATAYCLPQLIPSCIAHRYKVSKPYAPCLIKRAVFVLLRQYHQVSTPYYIVLILCETTC